MGGRYGALGALLLLALAFPAALMAHLEQSWAAAYAYPGNGDDQANEVVVDADGNVYVTGYSTGSGTGHDYATVKYDAAGNELWVARYNGPLGDRNDRANAIAVDAAGNVYVTGSITDFGIRITNDYGTVKYDAAGNELWVATYDGPGHAIDGAVSIAVDASGNVYVTGTSWDSISNYDYATIKYDAAGNELWVARYDGPKSGIDFAFSVAVDASGNAYVTGFSPEVGHMRDYATVKYDAAGNELWVARYNGPDSQPDEACFITLDASGNVYVTGTSVGSETGNDYATVKYDADGNEQWVARYNGPGNSYDYARAIAVDNTGAVYVTGYGYGSGTNYDYATVKYDADGDEQWVARYNGPANSSDRAYAIAVDNSGVYVTGYSYGTTTGQDYLTVQYDPESGEEVAVARYDGSASSEDCAYSIAVDGAGSVYVTGYCENLETGFDFVTIKYNKTWGGSTLTPGYWTKHPYYDPQYPDDPYVEAYLPVTVAGEEVNTVDDAMAIFKPRGRKTAWKEFLIQFLAAKLNAGWQNNPSLLAAWYDLPGGDYPFDNQRVSDIFEVADGYRSTTDDATLDEMKTVLYNINEYTGSENRCLWDAQFPPGPGPQGAEVTVLTPELGLSVAPSLAKSGNIRIAYSLPKAVPAQLKVLDITGRVVQTQEVAAGLTGTVGIDVSGLTAGVYVARLVAGDLDVSQPLVIVR